jgi:hypothetical protein
MLLVMLLQWRRVRAVLMLSQWLVVLAVQAS